MSFSDQLQCRYLNDNGTEIFRNFKMLSCQKFARSDESSMADLCAEAPRTFRENNMHKKLKQILHRVLKWEVVTGRRNSTLSSPEVLLYLSDNLDMLVREGRGLKGGAAASPFFFT